jgi:hypothetical protein
MKDAGRSYPEITLKKYDKPSQDLLKAQYPKQQWTRDLRKSLYPFPKTGTIAPEFSYVAWKD